MVDLEDIPDVCAMPLAPLEEIKMAARILSRLNLVSKRFFSAAAASESSIVEKQLAEAKHAACKSKYLALTWNLLYIAVQKVMTLISEKCRIRHFLKI